MKRCSRGDQCVHPMGCWQPATEAHFYARTDSLGKFYGKCRVCTTTEKRERRAINGDETRAKDRAYYALNAENKRASARLQRQKRHTQMREYNRQYAATHPERVRDYARRSRSNRREHRRLYNQQYRLKNVDKWRTYNAEWFRSNPQKKRLYERRRAARERQLPSTLTMMQWLDSLDFFDGCAYCGSKPDVYHADHFIPLSAVMCPGTVAENILPACPSCNLSKGSADPRVWLIRKFGTDEAERILIRILAYFDSFK